MQLSKEVTMERKCYAVNFWVLQNQNEWLCFPLNKFKFPILKAFHYQWKNRKTGKGH